MKKTVLLLVLLFIAASAQAASSNNRLLICANSSGTIVFDICGIRGCPTSVTLGKKTTNYNLKRVKNSNGSLSYLARAGSHPSCNIEISALRFGVRTASSVSCGTKLKGSHCNFKDPSGSSSSRSSSSSSSSSSSEDSH